jgi:hypothetical protein
MKILKSKFFVKVVFFQINIGRLKQLHPFLFEIAQSSFLDLFLFQEKGLCASRIFFSHFPCSKPATAAIGLRNMNIKIRYKFQELVRKI